MAALREPVEWRKTLLLTGLLPLLLAALIWVVFPAVDGAFGLHWGVITRNVRYFMLGTFPDPVKPFYGLGGFALTFFLSVVVIVMCFFVGTFFALMRISKNPLFKWPSIAYIEFIRGAPLLMVIFWSYFLMPVVRGKPLPEIPAGLMAMVLFYGGVMAEVVRAGILSIPQGQTEASISTGMTQAQTMLYIVMPQGFKNMIPAIVGTFIAVIKDTSLIYIIGVPEFTRTIFQVNNRVMNAPMELFLFAAIVYFVPCYLLSKWSMNLEKRLSTARPGEEQA